MKQLFFLSTITLFSISFSFAQSGRVGIGESNPGSKGSIKGNLSVGSSYSSQQAPANGAIIEGKTAIGSANPDASAKLQIDATDAGILIPRMNSTQRNAISSPATGLMIYDTDNKAFFYFDGAAWKNVGNTGPAGPTGDKGDTGAKGETGNTGATGFLQNGTATGQTPYWNGSTWVIDKNLYNNGGNIGIGTTAAPTQKLEVNGSTLLKGNAGVLNLAGTDHAYIQWYPQGGSTRKAWTGYGGGGDENFTIANEVYGRKIILSTAGGGVQVNNLAGTGNRPVYVTSNGTLTAATSVGGPWTPAESRYTVFVRRINQQSGYASTWTAAFTRTDEFGLPYPKGSNFPSGNVLNNGSPYSESGEPKNINPYFPRIDDDGWLGGGDNYALIYDFYIVFPSSGTHTFSMPRNASNNSDVDDVGALYAGPLNDLNPANMTQRLLYQQMGVAPTKATYTVTVAAGDMMRCRVYFSQGGGGRSLRLLVGGQNINMSWVYNIK